MKELNLLHVVLIYLAVINVVTFFMYGIDKWRSTSGRLLPTGRKKAKKSKWRIRETALLGLAVLGGSIGAWLGMKVWHHKTLHKKFRYGVPVILIAQIALFLLCSCRTASLSTSHSSQIEQSNFPEDSLQAAIRFGKENGQQSVYVISSSTEIPIMQEHSPNVFLVMYDVEIGKEPLLKAIEDYKCEIKYDYSIINGMALKKPDDKTLEETMQYFKKVKGVTNVEYDHVYRLTDPVKPRLEIK